MSGAGDFILPLLHCLFVKVTRLLLSRASEKEGAGGCHHFAPLQTYATWSPRFVPNLRNFSHEFRESARWHFLGWFISVFLEHACATLSAASVCEVLNVSKAWKSARMVHTLALVFGQVPYPEVAQTFYGTGTQCLRCASAK